MALIGRVHPLLVHFPIALVIAAAIAEAAGVIAGDDRWRPIAVANIRAGAMFAVLAAIAGWRLASDPGVEMSSLLEWHRWVGTVGAGMALAAALSSAAAGRRSSLIVWLYRTALFAAGMLVTVSGHLGGVMVWGANFLRP
jgi:uncharacterized membrane protein